MIPFHEIYIYFMTFEVKFVKEFYNKIKINFLIKIFMNQLIGISMKCLKCEFNDKELCGICMTRMAFAINN